MKVDGSFQVDENEISISYRILYRYIEIKREKIPGDLVGEKLKLTLAKNGLLSFIYNEKEYEPANRINAESKKRLKSIATNYIKSFEEKQGIR